MTELEQHQQHMLHEYAMRNESAQKGQILFVGSSLMEMFPIEKFIEEAALPVTVYNRGISGYITTQLEDALGVCVLELHPRRIFINIGTNDLSNPDVSIDELIVRYERIIDRIEQAIPAVEIVFMAYYPINIDVAPDYMKPSLQVRTNARITEANYAVEALAQKHNQRYINVNRALTDSLGRLKAEYTTEGMHIKEEGYRAIMDDLLPYILEPAWK